MLFNSFEFLFVFFPIVLLGYFFLNRLNQQSLAKILLIIASLYFYAYFNVDYLWIILSSIVVNFSITNYLAGRTKSNIRKLVFIVGILFNIGLLGYFKYTDFFIENINVLFGSELSFLRLMLPLGISFFTFQQLAFVVDSYYNENSRYKFLDYSNFVTFFPQLIAGPIVLPEEMLPQFEDEKNKQINWDNMARGFFLFMMGLAKKMLIADKLALYANKGFDDFATLSMGDAWITSLSYSFQLFFDFSGYCDMAMGIALMFNIHLPLNFNSPYRSTNIQDFWKRWHMTLGRFLTQYLYIPLGGNRKGPKRTLLNLFTVFLVSGIWHGAGWTFVLWGSMHGVAIIIHRIWKEAGYKMHRLIGITVTFFFVNLFWVLFAHRQ